VLWSALAVVVAVLLTLWITFTLTRLDRLHARVDAAQAAMDAQLVRRAAALLHVAESPDSGVPDDRRPGYDAIAQKALNIGDADEERQAAENAVGRAVAELAVLPQPLRPDAAAELREAAARVLIARRFYNDAVRDTRALRAGRMPRVLHMAGRRAMPRFFDIDDTLPAAEPPVSATPTKQDQPAPTTKEDQL
jgi:hypothetical protein